MVPATPKVAGGVVLPAEIILLSVEVRLGRKLDRRWGDGLSDF